MTHTRSFRYQVIHRDKLSVGNNESRKKLDNLLLQFNQRYLQKNRPMSLLESKRAIKEKEVESERTRLNFESSEREKERERLRDVELKLSPLPYPALSSATSFTFNNDQKEGDATHGTSTSTTTTTTAAAAAALPPAATLPSAILSMNVANDQLTYQSLLERLYGSVGDEFDDGKNKNNDSLDAWLLEGSYYLDEEEKEREREKEMKRKAAYDKHRATLKAALQHTHLDRKNKLAVSHASQALKDLQESTEKRELTAVEKVSKAKQNKTKKQSRKQKSTD